VCEPEIVYRDVIVEKIVNRTVYVEVPVETIITVEKIVYVEKENCTKE
jgi:hypothetical protein